MPVLTAEKCQA